MVAMTVMLSMPSTKLGLLLRISLSVILFCFSDVYFISGHGVCVYANKNVYDGAWLNDSRCGAGTLTFRNGDVFTGHFLRGVMHGQGVFCSGARGSEPVEAQWLHGDRVLVAAEEEEEDAEEKFDFGEDSVVF